MQNQGLDLKSLQPQLELGARLGGKAALTINYSNPDRGETAEILALFADAASQFGLSTNLEPRQLRHVIGVQLQSSGMPESMTPAEAMQFFCAYHGIAPRHDLLDRFGLSAKRKTQFHLLSTGQQRRLSLALAIAHEPQVLFLDEPKNALMEQDRNPASYRSDSKNLGINE